jgi:hypothetical protein
MLFFISRNPFALAPPRCSSSIDDDWDAVDADERACKANMSAWGLINAKAGEN